MSAWALWSAGRRNKLAQLICTIFHFSETVGPQIMSAALTGPFIKSPRVRTSCEKRVVITPHTHTHHWSELSGPTFNYLLMRWQSKTRLRFRRLLVKWEKDWIVMAATRLQIWMGRRTGSEWMNEVSIHSFARPISFEAIRHFFIGLGQEDQENHKFVNWQRSLLKTGLIWRRLTGMIEIWEEVCWGNSIK